MKINIIVVKHKTEEVLPNAPNLRSMESSKSVVEEENPPEFQTSNILMEAPPSQSPKHDVTTNQTEESQEGQGIILLFFLALILLVT